MATHVRAHLRRRGKAKAPLLKVQPTLVGYRGMVARDAVEFPEGFNVIVDTVNLSKRAESGDPGTKLFASFDALMGVTEQYETAAWVEAKDGRKLDMDVFPVIILARYHDEGAAIAGHNAIVDETRRGRISWRDMIHGTPLIDTPEVHSLLEERNALIRKIGDEVKG